MRSFERYWLGADRGPYLHPEVAVRHDHGAQPAKDCTYCPRPSELLMYPTQAADPIVQRECAEGVPMCSPHAGDNEATGRWTTEVPK